MSDIVRDLSRLGWSDERIGEELGMSPDEVLRLKQISGLAELFSEREFSEAWTCKINHSAVIRSGCGLPGYLRIKTDYGNIFTC